MDHSNSETGLLQTTAFSEENVRRGFIRKVYSILSFQLLVTMAVMGFFFIEPVKQYSASNSWIFWLAFATSLGCIFALSCFESVRRKSPGNLICLGIFTLGMYVYMFRIFHTFSFNPWRFYFKDLTVRCPTF